MAKGKNKKKNLSENSKIFVARPTKIPKSGIKEEEQLAPKPKVNWKIFWTYFVIVAGLALAVHACTVYGGLVMGDQAHFQDVSVAMRLPEFWSTHWATAVVHPLGQPWTNATYAWDLTSFPNWNASWSHTVNLFLHAGVAIYTYLLIFRFTWRLKNDERTTISPYFTAFAAASLFALHPLVTGAVAYISGREALLVALNYMLALNCFLFGYAAESLTLAFVGYFASMLFMGNAIWCDPRGMTIPVSIIALALVLKPPSQSWKLWAKARGSDLLFFGALALATPFLLTTIVPTGPSRNPLDGPALPMVSYWATQFKALVTYYLRCTLVPFGLSVEPPFVIAENFSDPLAIAGAVIWASSLGVVYAFRNNPFVCFGTLLFFLGILPNAFLPQSVYVGDQFFYLSLLGLCIVAGWGMGVYHAKNAKNAMIACVSVLVAFAGLSVVRELDWKTDAKLWKQALAYNPSSSRARLYYAQGIASENRVADAIVETQKVLKDEPDNPLAMEMLGRAYISQQKYTEAAPELEKAIAISEKAKKPTEQIAALERDLSICYMKMKNVPKQIEWAAKAQNALPDDPDVHLVLGTGLLAKKDWKGAFMQLSTGMAKDSQNPEYYMPLATAAVNSKMPEWVKYGYYSAQRAFMKDPNRDTALVYAKACLGSGKPGVAVRLLAKWASEKYNDPEVLLVTAMGFREMGEHGQERLVLGKALKLDPYILKKAADFYVSPSQVPSLEQVNARDKKAAAVKGNGNPAANGEPQPNAVPSTSGGNPNDDSDVESVVPIKPVGAVPIHETKPANPASSSNETTHGPTTIETKQSSKQNAAGAAQPATVKPVETAKPAQQNKESHH